MQSFHSFFHIFHRLIHFDIFKSVKIYISAVKLSVFLFCGRRFRDIERSNNEGVVLKGGGRFHFIKSQRRGLGKFLPKGDEFGN